MKYSISLFGFLGFFGKYGDMAHLQKVGYTLKVVD